MRREGLWGNGKRACWLYREARWDQTGVACSLTAVHNTLKRLRLHLKKKTPHASEQERSDVKARRVQSEILKANPTDPLLTHFRPLLGSGPEPKKS
jgi:hypothetical protein